MSGNTRHWRSEQGEGEIVVFIVLALLVLLATSAWKELKNSSLMFRGMSLTDASSIYSVNADGTAYISCGGAPVVTSSGGLFSQVETYEVRFLNSEGLETRLSGVHKVETSQMPAEVDAPMPPYPPPVDGTYTPYPPRVDGTYKDGTPYEEGKVYEWNQGWKARFRKIGWEAVKQRNDACDPPRKLIRIHVE